MKKTVKRILFIAICILIGGSIARAEYADTLNSPIHIQDNLFKHNFKEVINKNPIGYFDFFFKLDDYSLSPMSLNQAWEMRKYIKRSIDRIGIENIKEMSAVEFGRVLAEMFEVGFIDVSDERDYLYVKELASKVEIKNHEEFKELLAFDGLATSHEKAKDAYQPGKLEKFYQVLTQRGDFSSYVIVNPEHAGRDGLGFHVTVFHEMVEFLVEKNGAIDWKYQKSDGHTNVFVIEQELNLALQLGIFEEALEFRKEKVEANRFHIISVDYPRSFNIIKKAEKFLANNRGRIKRMRYLDVDLAVEGKKAFIDVLLKRKKQIQGIFDPLGKLSIGNAVIFNAVDQFLDRSI